MDFSIMHLDSTVAENSVARPLEGRGTEYGDKVNLSSDIHGFITAFTIERENPYDSSLYLPLLEAQLSPMGSNVEEILLTTIRISRRGPSLKKAADSEAN